MNDDRSTIEAKRARYLAILSAHRRVPVEILALIIEKAMIDMENDKNDTRPLDEHPIYTLMGVSRAWYQAALNVTAIWSKFKMTMSCPRSSVGGGPTATAVVRMWTKRMERWFSRAKGAGLELTLIIFGDWDRQLCRRWRSTLPGRACFEPFVVWGRHSCASCATPLWNA